MALVAHLLRLPSDLKARVASQAAIAGLTASEWMRRAIESATGADPLTFRADRSGDGRGERRVSIRADALEVERWEREAAEHGLNLSRYVRLQMSVTPEQSRRVATAVDELRGASVELARMGRNLNQVARSMQAFPGLSSAGQREVVMASCREMAAFSVKVTDVCGELGLRLGRRRPRMPTTRSTERVA